MTQPSRYDLDSVLAAKALVHSPRHSMRLRSVWIMIALLAIGFLPGPVVSSEPKNHRIPVILATDIGDDIDDTWALALLLRCPELDTRLIVTEYGKGLYRARLIAKFLELAGRTDIPIGIGQGKGPEGAGGQQKWLKDYDLESYPGTVHRDGAQALIDVVNRSDRQVIIIAVGPLTNVAEALTRDPGIARKARFVGTHGAIDKGYDGSDKVVPEYNVKSDVAACQKVFTAPWLMRIAPLDTCGLVVLRGDKFARVRDADDALLGALIENYYLWADQTESFKKPKAGITAESSTLFDTVTVYLATQHEFCRMAPLPVRVMDNGMTVIDPLAKRMHVALEWKDLESYEDWLVERLTRPASE